LPRIRQAFTELREGTFLKDRGTIAVKLQDESPETHDADMELRAPGELEPVLTFAGGKWMP